jgi:two-component system nitrogen regulation response regulator GlnG/two-component system response regulator AtoC
MEDLPALVSHFIGQLAPHRTLDVTAGGLAHLSAHDWPGNLRELRNSVAYALTVSTGAAPLEAPDFPPYPGAKVAGAEDEAASGGLIEAIDGWLEAKFEAEEGLAYRDLAGSLEATMIRRLLRRYDGKLARMASALQANRTTLRRRLRDTEG